MSPESGAVTARVDAAFVAAATAVVGAGFVFQDDAARLRYGTDALKRGHPADLVVVPGTTAEVAAVMCAHLAPTDPKGVEAALIAAVGEGRAERRPIGDGSLWSRR